MNRRFTTSLIIGFVALTLGACGGGSGDTSTDGADSVATVQTTVQATEDSEPAAPSTDTDIDAAEPNDSSTDTETATTDPKAPATTTTTVPSNPALDGFASIDGLSAPITAYGDRPVFTWDQVDGAATYDLWVLNADGTMYWAWSGQEAIIPLGGLPMLTAEAEGPDIAEGMRWTVSATDADGALIAFGAADFALD